MIIPVDLIDACKKQKCVPFIGAGFSAQSGLPDWASITSEMKLILIQRSDDKKNEKIWLKRNGALEIAERFKQSVTPADYQFFLNKWFDPPNTKPSNSHASLFSIRWPFLITTNFDRLLELTYSNVLQKLARTPITFDELVRAEIINEPYILKLHGSVENPESVILTETDYARMQTENVEMLDHIEKSILVFKKVLFLGFSMTDPEIRSAFLKSRLLTKGYALGDFIVLTNPNKIDVETWRKRGLTVIKLSNHGELAGFLQELASTIDTPTVSAPSISSPLNRSRTDISELKNPDLEFLPPLPAPFVCLTIAAAYEQHIAKRRKQYLLPKDYISLLRTNSITAIIGEAGAGKTTILCGAIEYLNKAKHPYLFVKAARLDAERISLRRYVADAINSRLQDMVLLVDGLDECKIELASSILSDLYYFAEAESSFTAIVTTRPIDIPELSEVCQYTVLPLSESDFFTLALGSTRKSKRIHDILNLAPSLHGRPLHAKSIGAYIEENGKEPESEADYALWSLDKYFTAENIYEELSNWVETTASQLYISSQSLVWTLADWASAAQEILPNEHQVHAVINAVKSLTGENKLFVGSENKIVPRHRTAFEAMVGRGLSRTEGLNKLLTTPGSVDESSIMLACLIKSLPKPIAKDTIAVVVNRAPWLATRVMLGAGAECEIQELLLSSEFELDLTSAIRHGVAILGSCSFIDLVKPLFSRKLRNPSLLSEVVNALETLVQSITIRKDLTLARALLDQLWREHKDMGVELDWVEIPGGYYTCGTNDGQDLDEQPEHIVFLNPFKISKFQVTNLSYEKFNPLYKRDRLSLEDDMPAVNVTWHEAQLFCRWITGNSGGRLPTEAEWESACRAGTTTRFYWGDTFDPSKANCGETMRDMAKVGTYPPNDFGLFDMAGNVYEWCLDWYDDDYYLEYAKINPTGPATGRMKVMRGGSWGRSANASASSYRVRQVPETRDVLVGFRACLPQQS